MKFSENFETKPEEDPESAKQLSQDKWFKVIQKLHARSGHVPDPLEIRARSIVSSLGIPSSEYSALETTSESKREKPERDKIVAKHLTNKTGVEIGEEKQVLSHDFRDFYPDGLPDKLEKSLNPDTLAIMKAECDHRRYVLEEFGDTSSQLKADCPVNYSRLPGGVDLFLRGYQHGERWQQIHGEFLKEANKHAKVIGIEGSVIKGFGNSLAKYWGEKEGQQGTYDELMRESVKAGFDGLFAEFDARDQSKVRMDTVWNGSHKVFPDLPDVFFNKYFNYLQSESPSLAKKIKSSENLENILEQLSLTKSGLHKGLIKNYVFENGIQYTEFPYRDSNGEIVSEPTFLELGKMLFTDALAAVKLHLTAKLMTDGHIDKGPIIDYEGMTHLSTKTFFLDHPEYAIEVVLRTINELMAGKVEGLEEVYDVFDNPDWSDVLKEITRLRFGKPEEDPKKSVDISNHQKKFLNVPVDFLDLYNINLDEVIPSDGEIKKVRNKLINDKFS